MTSRTTPSLSQSMRCVVRKFVDHSVTFETTPDAAANLYPGDYIRVASEVTHYEPDVNETGANDSASAASLQTTRLLAGKTTSTALFLLEVI